MAIPYVLYDAKLNQQPLVINLESQSIKAALTPEINQAFKNLHIKTLEIKNIFSETTQDVGGVKAFRTMMQIKLPEKFEEHGYLNALNEKEQWVSIYCSSGKTLDIKEAGILIWEY